MKVRIKLLGKLGIGLVLSVAVSAAEPTKGGNVPIPQPPKAKQNFSDTQKCMEEIEDIRRNHGWYLKHHRDDTMHRGVRSTKYSLVECINCHVVPDADGNYPNIKEGSKHFCRSCHSYAAVTIDCFQCHASKPQ